MQLLTSLQKKNIRRNKPAIGHWWRVATNEEIINEVIERLNKLNG